ncbi:DinB family protein [uncultured Psychroserpens sp.]|uniref:DinB family protein n=1 Tax=uncultured Psychroserpens sp. TaxID=255436 RepID=UPI0026036242|nr:DinB family protein [uncultured Psychroserpens sp.]
MESKTATPIVGLFQMQTNFFNKSIDGITEEHATTRISEQVNHITWITGHIVSCRYMLCGMLGMQVSEPYPDLFGNLKKIQDDITYPSLNELSKALPDITNQLVEKLSSMSEEEFQKDAFGGKLIDIVLFFTYHEAYHIGQLGILRKALGYDALKHN